MASLAAVLSLLLSSAWADEAAVEASVGCGRGDLPLGTQRGKISRHKVTVHDPLNRYKHRKYALYVPWSYSTSSPTPLVLDFHGFYDTATSEAKEDGLSLAAEQEGFLVAYPDGKADNPFDPGDWWNSWNGGGTNGSAGRFGKDYCTSDHSSYPCYESCARAGLCDGGKKHRSDCGSGTCTDDLGFVQTLLHHLKRRLCIDGARIHATGMSTGSIFLYAAAADPVIGRQLASIMPVEGSLMLGFLAGPAQGLPLAVIDIHGRRDDTIPANVSDSWGPYKRSGCPLEAAGRGKCTVGDDGWFYHPVDEILTTYAAAACAATSPALQPQAVPSRFDGLTGWSCTAPFGEGCERPILRCVHNGGHTWPFHEGHPRTRNKAFGEMFWHFVGPLRRYRPEARQETAVVV